MICFKNITNNETVIFTISDKSMALHERNKNIINARERGFIFNQINKLTIKIYSNLSHINIIIISNYEFPYYTDTSLENFLKILNMFKLIVMIEIIVSISHVEVGISIVTCFRILILILVQIVYNYTYENTNSFTCTKTL